MDSSHLRTFFMDYWTACRIFRARQLCFWFLYSITFRLFECFHAVDRRLTRQRLTSLFLHNRQRA